MAGEQSQFEGLLQNLLSTDNKIRVEAEVIELWVTYNIYVVDGFTVFAGFRFSAECLYTCRVYCTLHFSEFCIPKSTVSIVKFCRLHKLEFYYSGILL